MREPDPEHDRRIRTLAQLVAAFDDWAPGIAATIDRTPNDEVVIADVADRPPLVAPWGSRRVTLLGDAAHPATPDLGQGACQALEDAECLALRLARDSDVRAALRSYERRRAPRTSFLTAASRWFADESMTTSAPACHARELALSLTPRKVHLERRLRRFLDPYHAM